MRRRALLAAGMPSGGGINITVPLDDSGYGEFTNEQIEQITNYCLQFGESNPDGIIPDGFVLVINSIPMELVYWLQYNGETLIQGVATGKGEFFIGRGDKYIQF